MVCHQSCGQAFCRPLTARAISSYGILDTAVEQVTLVERGPSTSHNVLSWGHVELFSPYSLNMSEAGKSVLQEAGKALPDMDSFPTGAEYVRDYLDVLSSWLSSRCTIMCNSEVTAMARGALLRHELGAVRRSKVAFRIMIRTADGNEQILEAARVVDASGTYNQPASMGMGGMPALGESQMASRNDEALIRQIPDVKARREEFIGKNTVVVGAGASAITVINGLKKLSSGGGEDTGIVDVTWVVRGGVEPYRRVDNDPLPQRDALYSLGNKLSMGDKWCVTHFPKLPRLSCLRAGPSVVVAFVSFIHHSIIFSHFLLYLPSLFLTCPAAAVRFYSGGDRFRVRFIPNSGVLSMEKTQDGKVNVKVLKRREGEYEGGEEECIAADRVISCCGFKPNDGLWSQLQVHQCYASSAPMKLAGGDEPHLIAPCHFFFGLSNQIMVQ